MKIFSWLLLWTAAQTTPFDAAHPPTVRGIVSVPPALRESSFVRRFRDALEQTLLRHPNLILQGNVEVILRPTQEVLSSSDEDFVFEAEVVRQEPDPETKTRFTEVEVHLFDRGRRSNRDVFSFLAEEDDAEAYAEIAVDALVMRLIGRHLGVMRLVTPTPPRNLEVRVAGEQTRMIPTERFTTLPHGEGFETLSPLLLKGDYVVTWNGESRAVRVPSGGRGSVEWKVSEPPSRTLPELPPSQWTMAGVGNVRIESLSPERTVLVRAVDFPLKVLFHRGISGPPRLVWAQGFRAEQFFVHDDQAVILRDLPLGRYIIGTWWQKPSAWGKMHVVGMGMQRTFRLDGKETLLSAEEKPSRRGSSRLNLVWDVGGPPEGATLTLDGMYVADIFDAFEVSVFGVPEGDRLFRFEAKGYEPIERSVSLSADHETTLFLTLLPLEP